MNPMDPVRLEIARGLELRQDTDGPGIVTGVVVRYGDVARTRRGWERIRARAFLGLNDGNLAVNLGHRYGDNTLVHVGQGLTFTDGPDALRAETILPKSPAGLETANGVRSGALRGYSSEFVPVFEERAADGVTDVHKGLLTGLGIVEKPAYSQSLVEIRQRGFGGSFFYNIARTISDRGSQRKETYRPGAFDFTLADQSAEVVLYVGNARSAPVASRQAGSLVLTDGPDALEFEVAELPDTQPARDFENLLDNETIIPGVIPLIRVPPPDVVPDAFEDVPEPDNPGVTVRTYSNVVLTGLLVTNRQPAAEYGPTRNVALRAKRMLAWL